MPEADPDVVRYIPPTGSMRYDKGKDELWYLLIWPKAGAAVSKVMTEGAKKYEELNFTNATPETNPPTEFLGAAMRHMVKGSRWLVTKNPEHLIDEESGCNHFAHAIWNLMMLIEYILPEVSE